jgi:hypothetical protein
MGGLGYSTHVAMAVRRMKGGMELKPEIMVHQKVVSSDSATREKLRYT